MVRVVFGICFFWMTNTVLAQDQSTVFGVIRDLDSGKPIDFVSIYEKGTNNAVESDSYGEYKLLIPSNTESTIVFTRIGYQDATYQVPALPVNGKRYVNISMAPQSSDLDIVIRDSKIEDVGMVREEVTEFVKLPSTSGNFESVLPHIALGVSVGSGGELSAQYNVRGGNYDENLLYVNGFEIFRPQLVRNSQQEGLTFPNINLTRDLVFSSGGFESKYGDKLASVLDVSYKRPESFAGSVEASFLGASVHLEGSKKLGKNAYNKLRYLAGVRYKSTNYILGSLDTEGQYVPRFADVQTYITYDFSKELQFAWISNYNKSVFDYVPEQRSTITGLFNRTLQFLSVFEGSEKDDFLNAMTGVSFTFIPERDKNPIYLKLLGSAFTNQEEETFDILGFYRLSEIEADLGSENPGQEVAVLGVGTQHRNGRNYLNNSIYNVALKGGLELQSENGQSSNFLQWGLKYQREDLDDRLSEWERIDSAGYSLPFNPEEVLLSFSIKSENMLKTERYSGFVQNTFHIFDNPNTEFQFTTGVRANYWSLNDELLISPRVQILYKPKRLNTNMSFKLAGGYYAQPAFYRELRRPDGSLNTNLKAQKSTQIVAGFNYDFFWSRVSDKPFRFITELYYKNLWDVVSYEVDNVRIRYSGENDASGYIVGLDMRLNGEFVPGAESWINLSLLQARETILDVTHLEGFGENVTELNYVPRPTDQFMSLSLFFQDYLPNNENFKMNLNLNFGSGLPFGIRDNNQIYRNNFRYKSYIRVDIGFAYQLWDKTRIKSRPNHFFRFAEQSWLSLEFFNLLDISNVASNTWIKTIGQQQYAVPNFLTGRRINMKFRLDF